MPDAWSVFVHYATFHLPPQPDGFYQYDALQQLAYFGVVFIVAPLQMITAGAMSPALVNRYAWYPKLPGNRQIGCSLHFLFAVAFVLFFVSHVTMVAITGLARNMNHIVLGRNDSSMAGIYVGLVGLGVVAGAAAFAGEGGEYYDSHTMENLKHPQAMLAYEMNSARLTDEHGAPLRLRVENQLGFKMVKWIRAIEFVEDRKRVRKGEGGYDEDNEFFDCMADI